MKEERVIERLVKFAEWCRKGNICKSKSDFERMCGLAHNYLYNTLYNTKRSLGVDIIIKVHNKFPMLNVTWVITGKGAMITQEPDEGYREGYENMVKKMQEIQKIIERR